VTDTSLTKIEEFLTANSERQIDFLRELVRVPSDNPPGACALHAEHTAELLEELGFEVERHPIPENVCRANGMISAVNLVVRHTFSESGPIVALNAHGDVVAPGDGWTTNPYGGEIKDGWMYGRGVAVSKSDFATYAFALLALKEMQAPLAGTVELHFTYDEEVGGHLGPKWLLEHDITKPDLVISAGFSYSIVTSHNGCLHLEAVVRGKSAHAARPDTGHDALAAATRILGAIYDLRGQLSQRRSETTGIDTPSITVGLIEGGINTNVVPDKVTFRLDRRMIPEEDPEQVEAELRSLIEDEAATHDGISVDITRIMRANPLAPLPGAEGLIETLQRHAMDVFQQDIPVEGVPLYTDARLYMEAGIPTVIYGAGPRSLLEANGHRADERLRPEDMQKATRVIARTLIELLATR
jgi:succinyl-diaminopimelate desuccinylase